MQYAKEESVARKSGDSVRIAKAAADHEAYRQLCLKADELRIPGSSIEKVDDAQEGQ